MTERFRECPGYPLQGLLRCCMNWHNVFGDIACTIWWFWFRPPVQWSRTLTMFSCSWVYGANGTMWLDAEAPKRSKVLPVAKNTFFQNPDFKLFTCLYIAKWLLVIVLEQGRFALPQSIPFEGVLIFECSSLAEDKSRIAQSFDVTIQTRATVIAIATITSNVARPATWHAASQSSFISELTAIVCP